MTKKVEFYINRYPTFKNCKCHSGIVVFGKEYFFSGKGINIIEPGTWNDMKTKQEYDNKYLTNKSEKELYEFLSLSIFDPKTFNDHYDSEFFTRLVSDFLILGDVTTSTNYLRAVADISGQKLPHHASKLYINYYKHMTFWCHSGIVVYGKEYYYCINGVKEREPETWSGKKPFIQKNHCHTQVPKDNFIWGFLKQNIFKPEAYNTFNHNCNTFTELAFEFLTQERPQSTPSYIKAKNTASMNLVNRGNYYLQKLASAALDGGSASKDGVMAGGSVETAGVIGGSVGTMTGVGVMREAALASSRT